MGANARKRPDRQASSGMPGATYLFLLHFLAKRRDALSRAGVRTAILPASDLREAG